MKKNHLQFNILFHFHFLFLFCFLFLFLFISAVTNSANAKEDLGTFANPTLEESKAFLSAKSPKSSKDRSFSREKGWITLGLGLGRPQEKTHGPHSFYSYQSHGMGSLRLPFFRRIEIGGRYKYGLTLKGNDLIPQNIGKRTPHEEADASLGLAFPDIRPRWRLVTRLGGYYLTGPDFQLPNGKKKLVAPEFSLLWIYDQNNHDLFFMNLKYIHLDKGNPSDRPKIHTEYGFGAEAGEIFPIGGGLGFTYSVEVGQMAIMQAPNQLYKKLNIFASLGFAY